MLLELNKCIKSQNIQALLETPFNRCYGLILNNMIKVQRLVSRRLLALIDRYQRELLLCFHSSFFRNVEGKLVNVSLQQGDKIMKEFSLNSLISYYISIRSMSRVMKYSFAVMRFIY